MQTGEYVKIEDGFSMMKVRLQPATLSSTGKSNIIYTSHGFQMVDSSGAKYSITVIQPR